MNSRASAEPYTRAFTTTITDVSGSDVVLETTYFYPEGGGQPADVGTIGGVDVVDVQYRDDHVVHELAENPPFEAGDSVDASVDDAFRTYLMRAHTASHVLYGAGRRLLDDLGYGGFDIGADPENVDNGGHEAKVRVDFETSTEITDEILLEFERLTNRAVWDSRPVSWEQLPREEALSREDIAFNTKTEEGIQGDTVRIVTVDGWDVAACGGTHVENTREIGPVTVLDRSNPGEGLTRVEFTVGPRAIDRRVREKERAMSAARTLETRIEELPEAIERVRSERAELREELEALREDIVDAHLAELRQGTVEKNGVTWLVGAVPGLDANGLSEHAQEEVGDGADVVALVSDCGSYLAVATTGDVDASEIVSTVTDEFGGGGGGGPTLAQGGGLTADGDEIVATLRE